MELKNTIRVERARHRISQGVLANGVGCSRQNIHAIESEKVTPGITLVLKIVKYFNTLKSEGKKIQVEDLFKIE